jgi:hypothetical protein
MAYRMAIAFLGLSLVTILAGISWVCAEHWCVRNIPVQLWFAACAIGGVFVGVMLPFAPWRRKNDTAKTGDTNLTGPKRLVSSLKRWASRVRWGSALGGVAVALACLAAILLALGADKPLALYAVATALGGVLLGLPIPSPGRRDP